ncbi:MAG: zinc ribbon domain-containing protein, partial [Chloroflexota bacterium]
DEWVLCPDCHTTLKKICQNCRESLNLNWNVCPYCASPADAAPTHHHDNNATPEKVEETAVVVETEDKPGVTKPTTPEEDSSPAPANEEASPTPTRGDETRPHVPETNPV